jgi:invasion protein IalB
LTLAAYRHIREGNHPGAGSVKISAKLAILLALATFVLAGPSYAQQTPKSKAPAKAAQTTTPPATPAAPQAPDPAPPNAAASPGWAVRCSSASRDAPLECAMEQNAVFSKTGQLVALVNIRVPSDTHTPVALVQLPLGLNLPAGAKLQVDDGKTVDLQIQTCETRGCFANTPVAPDLLAALKSGKQLKISFQNLAKEAITIPMPLADFAAAYDKIK